MRVHVTQTDIDAANAARCGPDRFLFSTGCPVARALSREFGKDTLVDGTYFALISGAAFDSQSVELPHDAQLFTQQWDSRQPVQPFDFEV